MTLICSGITWSLDWMLAGVGAIGVLAVLLAHLHRRGAKRVVELPTARFIERAAGEAARRRRPRDMFFLLLRLACMVLIVGIFARPQLGDTSGDGQREAGLSDHTPASGVDVAYVVDASATMSRRVGGESLFGAAVMKVDVALERLDSSCDRACVIVAGGAPRALLPQLSVNIPALQHELREARWEGRHGDLRSAVRLAHEMLGNSPERLRQIIIVSDMQRTRWREAAEELAGIDAQVRVEAVGDSIGSSSGKGTRAAHNVGIEAMRIEHPGLGDAAADRVVVQLRDGSSDGSAAEARSCTVRLLTDNGSNAPPDEIGARSAILPASGAASVAFPIAQAPDGVRLMARLDDDDLTLDNVGSILVRHTTPPRVLVISGSRSDAASEESARTLALAARAAAPNAPTAASTTFEDLTAERAAKFDVLIVAAAGTVPREALRTLAARVLAGASLLWVVDSDASRDSCAAMDSLEPGLNLLPCSLGERLSTATALRCSPGDALLDPVGPMLVRVRPTEAWRLMPRDAGTTLMSSSDGGSFLVRSTAPRGARAVDGRAGTVAVLGFGLGAGHHSLAESPTLPILLSTAVMSARTGGRDESTIASLLDPREIDLNSIDAAAALECLGVPAANRLPAAPAAMVEARHSVFALWQVVGLGSLVGLSLESLFVCATGLLHGKRGAA